MLNVPPAVLDVRWPSAVEYGAFMIGREAIENAIATLFLDEQMRVRRFTTQTASIFKLIPSDVGRPITDQVTTLDYPTLASDAQEVLRTLVFREVQVRGEGASGNQELIRKDGFSLLDIKNYLARHDFVADAFEFPLAKLVEARLPALVLIVEKGYHHFVVVKGMQDGRVLIGDPSSGTRAMSRASFESLWGNKLLFVIHNKQEQARFNVLADWRVVPKAPLAAGMAADEIPALPWSKLGLGDY